MIQQMRKNKSIEEYNLKNKEWVRVLSSHSPKKKVKSNMQKAKSFKQGSVVNELTPENSTKTCINLGDISKGSKRSSTNRIDSVKDLESNTKKTRTKGKKRCWKGRGGCSGYIPPAAHKPLMLPSTHLSDHPVNLAIKNINQFIHLAFKIKNKDDYNIPAILTLGKTLGIIYPKTQIVDHNFLRSREFLSFSKEKILRYLYSAINKSNKNIEPDNSKNLVSFHQNRFFIGRGNNSILVRSVIKQRWWWSMNEREDFLKTNFIWTQWRKNKHLCVLDSVKEVENPEMKELK